MTAFHMLLALCSILISISASTSQNFPKNGSVNNTWDGICCAVQVLDVDFDAFDGTVGDGYLIYRCFTKRGHIYSLDLPSRFLNEHGNQLARQPTEICIDGAYSEHSYIVIPEGSEIRIMESRRSLQSVIPTTGTKSVLAVRVVGNDTAPSFDEATLREAVFDHQNSVVNQYSRCSNSELNMVKAAGNDAQIVDGVMNLNVGYALEGADLNDLDDNRTAGLYQQMQDLGLEINRYYSDPGDSDYDHVIFCLPDGVVIDGNPDWGAYAWVNGHTSFYRNEKCLQLSGLMHEVGHNLDLQHSSNGPNPCPSGDAYYGCRYGDETCLMGFSYGDQFGPLMCFNGAKHWQLGWFGSKRVDFDDTNLLDAGAWVGKLHGFVYVSSPEAAYVLFRIGAVYIQYNRADSYNSGNPDLRDTITFTGWDDSIPDNYSWQRGMFTHEGESRIVGNYGIQVCGEWSPAADMYAEMSVWDISRGQSSACPGETPAPVAPTPAPIAPTLSPVDPTPAPVTDAPSGGPTLAPVTSAPSEGPTAAPVTNAPVTNSPSGGPTAAPVTSAPSGGPTGSPVTSAPSGGPTAAPVTSAPSEGPTGAPVTSAPSGGPTAAPVTSAPSGGPTGAPVTSVPSGGPTAAPVTSAPSGGPTGAPVTSVPSGGPTAAPVTSAPSGGPTGAPVTSVPSGGPTAAPVSPTPAPLAATPRPIATASPVVPSPAPVSPTPAPIAPTLEPVAPSPAPIAPTPAPFVRTRSPDPFAPYAIAPVAPALLGKDFLTCDDTDGTFDFYGGPRGCGWLRFLDSIQIAALCERVLGVSSTCSETCGLCEDDCNDDVDASFYVDNRIQGKRNCEWIAAASFRKEKYCTAENAAFFHCKETCENCDGNFDEFPSVSPTATYVVDCADDKDSSFFYRGNKRDCNWLRQGSESQKSHLCVPEEKAYWICGESCSRCIADSSPTEDPCVDNLAYRFDFNNWHRKSCAWLADRRWYYTEACEDPNISKNCPGVCDAACDKP